MTPLPPAHLFTHEAMNTTFHLRICAPDQTAASHMARECSDHLDFLEARLSRFIEDSDVSRINHLHAGETLYINESTHQCLLAALDAHARTGGLFDITLGRRIEHRKSGEAGDVPPLLGRLTIHPDIAAVTCDEAGREIDLGGIGKGFALDQLRDILIDWGAEGGLLAAGASSLLAFGPDAWPVELSGDRQTERIDLFNQSLSASGTGIQGSHIVHPAGDAAMPPAPCTRLWVTAATATLAEIWSTALMLVEPDAMADFLAGEISVSGVHLDRGDKLERLR
ncbi:FAD:protein FMN transferase [bacterium]|nr:FAD:protein FMN transferase [bacterium]